MGAERDDAAAAKPRRMPTEPRPGGIPAGSGHGAAAAPVEHDDDPPEAVDFDALHAALGDPLALDELPHHEDDYDHPAHDDHDGLDEEQEEESSEEDEDAGGYEDEEPHVGESQGRSSAHYASARPHTIPPSNASTEDINAPPVIVASEDIGATVPSGPPQQMTKPINMTRPIALTPRSGVPFVSQPAHQSGPHAVAAAVPYAEPAPFTEPPAYPRGAAQMTVRMPDRPAVVVNPRRGKIQTLVVRPRGPSTKQKLFAFMAMLLLVTACGIAVIIWRKPAWVGLEPSAPPVAQPQPQTPPTTTAASPESTTPTSTATVPVVATASAAPSAGASASSAGKVKPKPSASASSAPPSPR